VLVVEYYICCLKSAVIKYLLLYHPGRETRAEPWCDKECRVARHGILSYTAKLDYLTLKQYPTRADLHVQCRRRAIHSLTKLGSHDVPQCG
jgi:hypothetical protein